MNVSLLPSFGELAPQFKAILGYWWLWLPMVLFALLYQLWLMHVREEYKRKAGGVLLEIRIPRELKKSPKSMEQIIAGLYGLRNAPGNIIEYYVDGEVTLWFSLEIISLSGDIHFYIRAPKKHKTIVEALFYAQYPDIEIAEVPDYMDTLPKTMHEVHTTGYELWGSELVLVKPDAYPIRTYEDFSSTVEEEQLDPVSALLEIFGKMRRGEKVVLQVLIRPADNRWVEKTEALLNEMKTKTAKTYKRQIAIPAGESGADEMAASIARTPGEIETMKAMSRNISKPGFETVIRFLYIAPKEIYGINLPKRGIFASFNQYAVPNMNYFRHNHKMRTEAWWVEPPYIFPKRRMIAKKRRILKNYRERRMPEETFASKIFTSELFDWNLKSQTITLNTEELATIWHLPSHLVLTAPFVRRVESRKMGPPAGLPIYHQEGEELPWEVPKPK